MENYNFNLRIVSIQFFWYDWKKIIYEHDRRARGVSDIRDTLSIVMHMCIATHVDGYNVD